MANILVDEKRYEEGISIYKIAQKLEPDDIKITTFIANAYFLLQNITQAIKYYKKAIKQAPKDNEIKLIYLDIINCCILIRRLKLKI